MLNAWQYYMFKLISRLVCLLPYPAVLKIGGLLGRLYYRIASRQRQRALTQIRESRSASWEKSESIIRSLFVKLGQTFLEVMYMPVLTKNNIRNFVTIDNEEYLQAALAEGRGVAVLTAHFGNWEWLGAALALYGYPTASIVKRQPNDQHTRLINEYRELVGIEIFKRGTSEVLSAARAFKQGKILGLLSDQDAGPNGLFIEFLGKMASTPQGAAVFAKKFKAPVVPAFIVRRPEGGHRLIVQQPLYYKDTGNQTQDIYNFMTLLTGIIEAMIRRYPDEWLWFQKRWNTRFEQSAANPGLPAEDIKAGEQA